MTQSTYWLTLLSSSLICCQLSCTPDTDVIPVPTKPTASLLQEKTQMRLSLSGSIITSNPSRPLEQRINIATYDKLCEENTFPMLCFIKSSDTTQPITKVIINWYITQNNQIECIPNQLIHLEPSTNLNKGDWYIMGIISCQQSKKGIEIVHDLSNLLKTNQFEERCYSILSMHCKWNKLNIDHQQHTLSCSTPLLFNLSASLIEK